MAGHTRRHHYGWSVMRDKPGTGTISLIEWCWYISFVSMLLRVSQCSNLENRDQTMIKPRCVAGHEAWWCYHARGSREECRVCTFGDQRSFVCIERWVRRLGGVTVRTCGESKTLARETEMEANKTEVVARAECVHNTESEMEVTKHIWWSHHVFFQKNNILPHGS